MRSLGDARGALALRRAEGRAEPAAAPLVPVPHEQAVESLFAALAAEADEETAGA
jgi:hypothetical protein